MTLKIATEADLSYLLDFARKFHDNSPYREFSFNPEKVSTLILHMINNPIGLILILEKDGIPVGCLAAVVEDFLFGNDRTAMEIMFWVEPGHRGMGSWELPRAYQFWANKLGCKIVTMSSLEGGNTVALDRIYRGMGFAPYEHTYMKVL